MARRLSVTLCFFTFLATLLHGRQAVRSDPVIYNANGDREILSNNFSQKLKATLKAEKILYAIAGARHYEHKIYIKLRLPQCLTTEEILVQGLLYFRLLATEKERRATSLLIYPYFVPVKDTAYIQLTFNGENEYSWEIRAWPYISNLLKPEPDEIKIYNRILERVLSTAMSVDSISAATYEKVADATGKSVAEVKAIYRKVRLWSLKYSAGM